MGQRNLILKVLITGAIGGFTYLITNLAEQPQVWSITISVFLSGVALVVQFLADFDARLRAMEARQVEESNRLRRVVRRDIAQISQATELFAEVGAADVRTDAVVALVRHAIRLDLGKDALITKVATAQINALAEFLRNVVERFETDREGQEQDWLYALVNNAKESMKATSTIGQLGTGLVDDDFWRSAEATRYLDVQRRAAKRGIRIQRLFIIQPSAVSDPDGPDGYEAIVARSRAAGVDVRVLPMDRIPNDRTERGDFILFDDSISYEFVTEPTRQGPSMLISTRLRMRAEHIRRRQERFNELWTLAEEESAGDQADDASGAAPGHRDA